MKARLNQAILNRAIKITLKPPL